MQPVAHMIQIDRSSPIPLYFQVAQRIEELIKSGQMPPGFRLENEIALADQLGLSRPTMRHAMQHLVDRGLVVRRRGVGTEVVHPRVRRQVELSSLYDDLERAHRHPRTDVLSFAVTAAPEEAARALNLATGAEVIAVERLRFADEEPLALMHNYLPVGIADLTAETLAAGGLYQALRESGVRLGVAEQSIGARRASAREARLLREPRGAPLLTMNRTAYDRAGRVVEYGAHVYRAGRYSVELTLVAGRS